MYQALSFSGNLRTKTEIIDKINVLLYMTIVCGIRKV